MGKMGEKKVIVVLKCVTKCGVKMVCEEGEGDGVVKKKMMMRKKN